MLEQLLKDVNGKEERKKRSDGYLYACACNALCAMFMRCRSHALAAARIPFRHLCESAQMKWQY